MTLGEPKRQNLDNGILAVRLRYLYFARPLIPPNDGVQKESIMITEIIIAIFVVSSIVTAAIMINADRLAGKKSNVVEKSIKLVKEINGEMTLVDSGRKAYIQTYTCPCCGVGVEAEAGQVEGEVLCRTCEYEFAYKGIY